MPEVEVAGHTYNIGKLTARQQFDITRRLGFVANILEQEVEPEHADGARFIAGLLTNAFATVSQADMDFVLDVCLGVITTKRTEGSRPVSIWNLQGRVPQFEDMGIDMPVMMELVDAVIQENLASFFEQLRRNRPPPPGSEGAGTESA